MQNLRNWSPGTTPNLAKVGSVGTKDEDDSDNLCLSCANCNLSKAKATTAGDPLTKIDTPLFNPRQQIWHDHFEWIDGGGRVHGKTPIGRATVFRLKMNQERIIRARGNWIESEHILQI
jgi:hypothetical protein